MSLAAESAFNLRPAVGNSMSAYMLKARNLKLAHGLRVENFTSSISDARTEESGASLIEKLFDERAKLKVTVSKISMHLEPAWRESIFRQLDLLYSIENWEDDSTFAKTDALQTLLRFIVFATPKSLPGLAIAPNGNPVASWVVDERRVHIEFLPNDHAHALLAKSTERGAEAVSWRGPVTNISEFVRAFGNAVCLGW